MIVFNNPQHGRLIAREAGCHFNPEVDVCIARCDGPVLLGGVTYQNYTGESIGIHVASLVPTWLNRDLLWVSFDYPFNQLGVKRIFGQVPETNTTALEFDLRIGFKVLTKIDGVFRDGGVFVIVLEREDCRWLDMKPRNLKRGQEN